MSVTGSSEAMSTMLPPERALIERAQSQGLLPPEAQAAWRQAGPSWIVTTLSFAGAQLVVLPFLGFLLLLDGDFFFEAPGAFAAAAVLVGTATGLLRQRPGMFVTQLSFSALLAGLALAVIGLRGALHNLELLALVLVLVSVALASRVAWVQRVLGFLATGAALALMLWLPGSAGARSDWALWELRLAVFPMVPNAALLALVWALGVGREQHWSVRSWSPALHALLDGMVAALLLAVVYGSTRHFWGLAWPGGGPAGSADVPTAGLARIFSPDWAALLQMALVLAAALWLVRHWRLREHLSARDLGLLTLVGALLLLACLVLPHVGVVALIAAVALGTGRRRVLGLAGAVLLAQLSGFYYALDWPLANKAGLLAGSGMTLGLALWLLSGARLPRRPASAAAAQAPGRRWLAPALMVLGTVLSLTLAHLDVRSKEQVIAEGQRIYLPLAPRDPRSLMQGDYMALNFAFPAQVHNALQEAASRGGRRQAQVVALLDERGVATVQRLAREGQPLAPNERLLPLKRLKGDWVLVTDAFYFPEGQGTPLAAARFGEFRALPDGRALLVGLADQHLQAIAPAPRRREP